VNGDKHSSTVRIRPRPEESSAESTVGFEWFDVNTQATVTGEVARGPIGFVITHMAISSPSPSGVTRELLRDVPIRDVIAAARSHAQARQALLAPPSPVSVPVTSGRTEMTDDLLQRVAIAYLEETAPGRERGAIQRMVDRFDRPRGTVQTWIKRARKEGWLAPGPPGRMGAEWGPRLIAKYEGEGLILPEGVSEPPMVKPGTEAQLAEYNQRLAEWERLPDSDPHKAELGRELEATLLRKSV
jgi:hypothetical protein